ncbi:MAG: 50S ribosomal protein L10 [Bacteroidetes bacterium]|nr:MAG: 50S ribosomal protein L10 [Bacteroidota bacterium]MBL1146027.1 50S ribosomal protein L10 [Bacteroidota bacterium]MCB0802002.1 50S ribosomal protein L10 [Flavobacteriales bacterium]NOG58821.1 50S ribosomal protein L10 [Bacteroidota bacterium]
MTRQEKDEVVKNLSAKLNENSIFYLADISDLDAENSTKLRKLAFKREVSLNVVKNTLLRKALEAAEGNYDEFYDVLKGNTSIMFSEVGNAPAKLIKDFRKSSNRPILKGAYIEEAIYIGDNQIDALVQIKSKEELIGDIIAILQSPAKNVLSALQSGGNTIAGLVKALEERKS